MPSGRLSTSITSFDRERECRVDDETNWISSSSRRSTSIMSAWWERVSVVGVGRTVADIARVTVNMGGDGRGCSQSRRSRPFGRWTVDRRWSGAA